MFIISQNSLQLRYFFSNDENPFKKVLENVKKSFKNINIDNINLILMINAF